MNPSLSCTPRVRLTARCTYRDDRSVTRERRQHRLLDHHPEAYDIHSWRGLHDELRRASSSFNIRLQNWRGFIFVIDLTSRKFLSGHQPARLFHIYFECVTGPGISQERDFVLRLSEL